MKNNLLVLLTIICVSCGKMIDCKEKTQSISNERCELVVSSSPTAYSSFKVVGYDPIAKNKKTCETSNRWWDLYVNEISVGDTIVKKKGSLIFSIHKKDTIINHMYKCY